MSVTRRARVLQFSVFVEACLFAPTCAKRKYRREIPLLQLLLAFRLSCACNAFFAAPATATPDFAMRSVFGRARRFQRVASGASRGFAPRFAPSRARPAMLERAKHRHAPHSRSGKPTLNPIGTTAQQRVLRPAPFAATGCDVLTVTWRPTKAASAHREAGKPKTAAA